MQRRQVYSQNPIGKEAKVVEVDGISSFILGTRQGEEVTLSNDGLLQCCSPGGFKGLGLWGIF